MKIKSILMIGALSLTTALATARAQTSTWTIDPAHSSAEFKILHMGVSHVHGSLTGLKGTVEYDEKNLAKSHITATVDTTTVSTGNDARDKHLKTPEFFDTTKFPTMTFTSTSISNTDGKLQMTGDLTLAGVTKPITLNVDGPAPPQKGMGAKLVSGFSATGVLKRTDFNFGSKYSSPMLGDEVTLSIDVEIDK